MIIQVNSDNNIAIDEELEKELDTLIADKLKRFSNQLTRVEVYFSDENSHKGGGEDKKCVMEARMEGMHPIVVTDNNETLMQAVNAAIGKLKSALDSAVGKARHY